MDDFGSGGDAYSGFQVDPNSLTDLGMPQWYNSVQTPQEFLDAGIEFDPNSKFGDYSLADLQKLGIGKNSSITGIDANTFMALNYPTQDPSLWKSVTYNKTPSGWAASKTETGQDSNFSFGDALKVAAPLLLNFIPGVGTGLSSLFGGGMLGNVAAGATLGGTTSALSGGKFGKGALLGGIGAGLGTATRMYNPAAKLGIENPTLGKMFNNTLNTATMTGLRGGDVGKAVGSSLLRDGLNFAGSKMFSGEDKMNGGMSYGGDGTLSLGSFLQNPQTFAPAASTRYDDMGMDNDWQQNLFGSSLDFGGQQSVAPNGMSIPGNSTQPNPLISFLRDSMTRGGRQPVGAGLGDMAGSLLQLYRANRARKDLQGQISGLQGMFGQDSSYATTMRNQLNRRDAAAGRRSQYGPREVELQAKLAEMGQRNAPQLAQLYQGQNQARQMQNLALLNMIRQSGMLDGLGKMFGG